MNIEEERQVFIVFYMTEGGNAYYPVDTGFDGAEFYDPIVQRAFKVWLAAKAHAEEVAKPSCRQSYCGVCGGSGVITL